MLIRVIDKSIPALTLLVFLLIIGGILFASLIFFAEQGVYDEASGLFLRDNVNKTGKEPSPFLSILDSFWW